MRRDASARVARLGAEYDALAERLGTLALAWHSHACDSVALAHRVAAALAPSERTDKTPLDAAATLLDAVAQHDAHLDALLSPRRYGVPSLLTRAWPLLVAYPVASVAITRYLTTHWHSLAAQVQQAGEALRGLVVDWVWAPSVRLLDTLRAGRAERRLIVSRDSLAADQQSLGRMVRAFGEDQLRLSGPELEASLERAQHGDLTGVMERYERDIRAPLRSLVGGSLVRTVLIQVQKAKVDLEVALNGIDWLLHSQELLIAFAGLAPALALVYVLGREALHLARALLYGRASVQAQRSLQEARLEAWEALRHIDALVARAPGAPPAPAYGHLLLHLDQLRAAFATLLPAAARSRAVAACLASEVADDLCTLEVAGQSAVLAADEHAWAHRQATVERMWRSWSWLLAMDRLVH